MTKQPDRRTAKQVAAMAEKARIKSLYRSLGIPKGWLKASGVKITRNRGAVEVRIRK